MVRVGLEPTRLSAQAPKTCVAANYTTGPRTDKESTRFWVLILHANRCKMLSFACRISI